MSLQPDDDKDDLGEVLPSPPASEPTADSEDIPDNRENDAAEDTIKKKEDNDGAGDIPKKKEDNDGAKDSPVKKEDDDAYKPAIDQNESASSSTGRVTRNVIRPKEVEEERKHFLDMDLESKRKLYRSKHTSLDELQTWQEHYLYLLKSGRKVPQYSVSKTEMQKEVRIDLNKKLSLFQGDITTLEIDAIVNAANESLLGGGGVDGAIHRAAGPLLKTECKTLNGCDPGDAKITCGYKLPAKFVIHTVGPRGENSRVLKRCYVRCLQLAKENKLKTIAFPCISTGIFGYPNSRAASVVVKTLREWLETDEYAPDIERIILCLFLKVDVNEYEKLLPIYFPVGKTAASSSVGNTTNSSAGRTASSSAVNTAGSSKNWNRSNDRKDKSTSKPQESSDDEVEKNEDKSETPVPKKQL